MREPRPGHALVVGESLVDVVVGADGSTHETPGGSAANVATALSRLGRPTHLLTALGPDARGDRLRDHLAGADVLLDPATTMLPRRTSTASARIGPTGAASYEFDIAWPAFEVPVDAAAPLFVHVGSLGAVLAPGADSVLDLLAALRDHSHVSYDVNARPAVTGSGPDVVERVERLAGHAHLVKASDEDLACLYPSLTPDQAAARLLGLGPSVVVVTAGERGLFALAEAGRVEAAAAPVRVVDTIGAGDTVSAALIDALWPAAGRPAVGWDGVDQAGALAHAARAAAVTTSRPGADPPYRGELGDGWVEGAPGE